VVSIAYTLPEISLPEEFCRVTASRGERRAASKKRPAEAGLVMEPTE
jgi:hypothetical protein